MKSIPDYYCGYGLMALDDYRHQFGKIINVGSINNGPDLQYPQQQMPAPDEHDIAGAFRKLILGC